MNLMRIGLAAMMTAVLSMGIACAQEPVDPQPAKPLTYVHPSYHKVTPDVAKKMMEEGVVLIDVREPDEFAEGHVKGAVNVPMSVLKPGMKLKAVPNLNDKVLVQCKSGVRAENASKILIETGYKNVYNAYGTQFAIFKTSDRSADAKTRFAGRFCFGAQLWLHRHRMGNFDVVEHVLIAIGRAGLVNRHGKLYRCTASPLNLRQVQHTSAPVKRTFEKNCVSTSGNRLALFIGSVPGVTQSSV